jgi:hypothetical protein
VKQFFFLTVCLLLGINGLFAQTSQEGRFSVGISLGLNRTFNKLEPPGQRAGIEAQNSSLQMHFFPLVLEYRISNRFNIMSGYMEPLFFTKWRYLDILVGKDTYETLEIGIAPQTIPVFLYYDFYETERHAFSVMGGGSYGYCHYEYFQKQDLSAMIASGEDFYSESAETLHENLFNLNFGLRWSYKFAKKWHLQANLMYNKGLVSYERWHFNYRVNGQLYYNSIVQNGNYMTLNFSVHRYFKFKKTKKQASN